jgi:hypothetical protein
MLHASCLEVLFLKYDLALMGTILTDLYFFFSAARGVKC